jgi:hypothetical protein
MFWRLALGKCVQAKPNSLVSPGKAVIIKPRVGLEKLTYCYLSDLDTNVYIEEFHNRALFFLDSDKEFGATGDLLNSLVYYTHG